MKINLKVFKELFINYNWWGCLDPRPLQALIGVTYWNEQPATLLCHFNLWSLT